MLTRFRQALLVLFVAGTILNVWAGFDALARVSKMIYVNDEYIDLSKPPARLYNSTVVGTSAAGTTTSQLFSPAEIAAFDLKQTDLYQKALADYHGYQVRIWERPAKIEFALIAGIACIWLLLPRATVPRPTD